MRPLWYVLLLAGCAAPPENTPQAFCAAVANRDPAVKALVLRGVSNPNFINQSQSEIAAARQTAERDCLRRQGVLPQSDGVQGAPARSDTLFQ
jgi:hypothetical protein